MDNQDNQNCPINPVPNTGFFSPNKDSPNKDPHQIKYLYQSSPFPSGIFTPSKKNFFCPSLGETPLQIGSIFSPESGEPRGDISYQKNQNLQKGQVFSEYSLFKPMLTSPNQRISDKK